MHMAFDIKSSFFDVTIAGEASTRDALLEWDKRDRLGIVVDRPFGALDASLMIFLAATAFYDAGKKRRMRPLYPDMYLFHAGGPWGAHSTMDFAPDHKEILVTDTPQELLRAINHVGITHLLLPDRTPQEVQHRYKEPEAAIDRMKQAFVYGPAGSVRDPDVTISAHPFAPLFGTFDSTLTPEPYLIMLEEMGAAPQTRATDKDELAIMLPMLRSRLSEVAADHPDLLRHRARVTAAQADDRLAEDYRRVAIKDAINMLHRQD